MNIEFSEEVREDKIKDYIEYIDRSRRTNGKRRIEIHNLLLTREVAKSYKLTEKQINDLTIQFENEFDTFPLPK